MVPSYMPVVCASVLSTSRRRRFVLVLSAAVLVLVIDPAAAGAAMKTHPRLAPSANRWRQPVEGPPGGALSADGWSTTSTALRAEHECDWFGDLRSVWVRGQETLAQRRDHCSGVRRTGRDNGPVLRCQRYSSAKPSADVASWLLGPVSRVM